MAVNATELTIVDQVEQSALIRELDVRSAALAELLPDPGAVDRFRRGVAIAVVRNPELLECTTSSFVLAVFEAASRGLDPTREAHFVPRNVNVGTKDRPRYEKQVTMVPDYRGVIRLVTQKGSEVLSMQPVVVKEGDEFEYEQGSEAWVRHKPSLDPGRSAKATTHIYSIARLRAGGPPLIDVMDRSAIERVQKRARPNGFSPWASDWDEMGAKTVVKHHSKVLPVPADVRELLMREDDTFDADTPAITAPTGPTRAAQLGSRIRRPRNVTPQVAPGAADPTDPPTDTAATGESAAQADAGDTTSEGEVREEPLTRARFGELVAAEGLDLKVAERIRKERWPDTSVELTPDQRAELLAELRDRQASLL